MSLQGSLKKTPVSELFLQLVDEKQTGILHLKKGKSEFELDWINGRVIHIIDKATPMEDRIGRLLLYSGHLSEEQLEQALQQQRRYLDPLGLILRRMFGVDDKAITSILRVQAIERVQTLLFWTSGDFTFEETEIVPPKLSYRALDIDKIVEETMPIAEIWPHLKRRFSEPQLRVERQTEKPTDIKITDLQLLEQDIYKLLKKPSTLRTVAIRSGAGRYVSACALHVLQHSGFIKVEAVQKQRIQVKKLVFGSSIREFAVWVCACAFLCILGSYTLLFAPYSPAQLLKDRYQHKAAGTHFVFQVERWRTARLKHALELYKKTHKTYPEKLEDLVKQGWISPEFLSYIGGKRYVYERINAKKFHLLIPPL